MSDRMTTGWLAGHRIRTAQKAAQCDYWNDGRQCTHIIEAGQRYVEGRANDTPGWGADRICARHAGLDQPDTFQPISAVVGQILARASKD